MVPMGCQRSELAASQAKLRESIVQQLVKICALHSEPSAEDGAALPEPNTQRPYGHAVASIMPSTWTGALRVHCNVVIKHFGLRTAD